jgi:hypothetical protein
MKFAGWVPKIKFKYGRGAWHSGMSFRVWKNSDISQMRKHHKKIDILGRHSINVRTESIWRRFRTLRKAYILRIVLKLKSSMPSDGFFIFLPPDSLIACLSTRILLMKFNKEIGGSGGTM